MVFLVSSSYGAILKKSTMLQHLMIIGLVSDPSTSDHHHAVLRKTKTTMAKKTTKEKVKKL